MIKFFLYHSIYIVFIINERIIKPRQFKETGVADRNQKKRDKRLFSEEKT
jgi:hypothetical protein